MLVITGRPPGTTECLLRLWPFAIISDIKNQGVGAP